MWLGNAKFLNLLIQMYGKSFGSDPIPGIIVSILLSFFYVLLSLPFYIIGFSSHESNIKFKKI